MDTIKALPSTEIAPSDEDVENHVVANIDGQLYVARKYFIPTRPKVDGMYIAGYVENRWATLSGDIQVSAQKEGRGGDDS